MLAEVASQRVLPVVQLRRVEDAAWLGPLLLEAGLRCVEVMLRTAAAPAAIAALADRDGLLVAAGTVREAADVDRAVASGARLVVSPAGNEAVSLRARSLGVPELPGVMTPTELEAALRAGAEAVKLFPAELAGGVAAVRALAGPFPEARFVPTGGIGPAEAPAYLREASVLAVGGSWMVPPAMIEAGRGDEVARLLSEAATLARGEEL